jgi:hypothetical protein
MTIPRRTELEKLTAAFWAHLRTNPTLPEPCTVTLDPSGSEVQVQVPPAAAVAHLGELLLWAYTLQAVTAQWWNTGHSLHITLWGRGAGTRFRVYGALPLTDCAGLVCLAVDGRENVSVDEIYTLRQQLREQQEDGPAGVVA